MGRKDSGMVGEPGGGRESSSLTFITAVDGYRLQHTKDWPYTCPAERDEDAHQRRHPETCEFFPLRSRGGVEGTVRKSDRNRPRFGGAWNLHNWGPSKKVTNAKSGTKV